MKKTKYVICGGLAFSEKKDFKKLQKLAKEGWILEGFRFGFFYKLRKEEPQDILYSLDYQQKADAEYFSFFESAGWTHICSLGNEVHIFSAPLEAKPIYTDKQSFIDKYVREKNSMAKVALPSLLLSIIMIWLYHGNNYGQLLQSAIGLISILSNIVFIFSALPYIAFSFTIRKLIKELNYSE